MHKQIVLTLVAATTLVGAGVFYANTGSWNVSQEPAPERRVRECCDLGTGKIEGRVLNIEGQPVAGAKVYAQRDEVLTGLVSSALSDKDGNYTIEVEGVGIYTVSASKEEDGYADTLSGFHQEGVIVIPKVNVNENEVVRGVEVRFGPKAETLEGVITEAETGKPISRAAVTLRRADDPRILYSINADEEKKGGKFKVLVPQVPFTIEVSAPDYETWAYSKDGHNKRADSLKVNRGEARKFDIRLRPKRRP